MATTVTTPDGEKHHHRDSVTTGRPQARRLADGRVEVFFVQSTGEPQRRAAGVVPGEYKEKIIETYPAGSSFTRW
ncbi:hypothetical protein [Parenemella sanctibonifatiensis]|uniref:Uncharacterized protein n=1 Tax=Parenemella sanctibonifatiensis TaxID=2016505 RepID=A0A255E3N0_9ACTN|nr:hypothetical protein [Parenemella sanctibonifatiensis]OYN83982.1 hypothetical protein CGZ92_13035 [Parenemella sanctibonifatiensis]